MRGWAIGLVLVVATILALGIGLVAWYASSDTTALLDLEPGQCFDLPDTAAGGRDRVEVVETVEVIACGEPHGAEVVAAGELNPDGALDYPPDAELFGLLDPRCGAVAEEIPTDRYGVVPIAPTERSWTAFDGRYLCIAVPVGGGPVTGSLAGTIADG